jgi:hypothetical protein
MSEAVKKAQEEIQLDMTPMIDCVFLMIIFFICIEFKVLEAKLPAYLPKDKGSQSTKVEPMEQLSVGIYKDRDGQKVWPQGGGEGVVKEGSKRPYRFALVGHSVYWMVGPRRVNSQDELKKELERIYNDKNTWQPDKDHPGTTKPMPVVIEPHPGTYYNDTAITADAAKAAGFPEIKFGGGLGAQPLGKR